MSTKAVLGERALRKLGLLMAGEAASAEDALVAQEKVQAVHDSLAARGLTRWTIADIPAYADEPYTLMAAALMASDFGVPANAAPSFETGENELRRVIATPATGEPVPFEAY